MNELYQARESWARIQRTRAAASLSPSRKKALLAIAEWLENRQMELLAIQAGCHTAALQFSNEATELAQSDRSTLPQIDEALAASAAYRAFALYLNRYLASEEQGIRSANSVEKNER